MAGLELMICPSCGKDLGSLEPAYMYLTQLSKEFMLKKPKYKNLDPRVYNITPDTTDYEEILNSLNIERVCCRTHKLTASKMRDLYHSFSRPS